jgi:hypothetical protein
MIISSFIPEHGLQARAFEPQCNGGTRPVYFSRAALPHADPALILNMRILWSHLHGTILRKAFQAKQGSLHHQEPADFFSVHTA